MDLFLARQPIFDKHHNVYGYELLYRSNQNNVYNHFDGDQASLNVIHNAFLLTGPENISGGKKIFINFTANLLKNKVALSLPKQLLVVEILENIAPDKTILSVCAELKKAGYTLALDDFVLHSPQVNSLINYADIIKVDFRQSSLDDIQKIAEHSIHKGIKLLAEKTETLEELTVAKSLGYIFFQGYFFSKPLIIATRDIPSHKLAHLQMLHEINQTDLSIECLEAIVKRDTSLTYKLLKYINSVSFGMSQPIDSIKHAMVLLGEKEVRKWASLIIFTKIAQDNTPELLMSSLIRAKFSESLADEMGFRDKKSMLFLAGMFSLLDAMIGRPLAEVLEKIPLPEDIKKALLGEDNRYRDLLGMVIHYEKADWQNFAKFAQKINFDENKIPDLYLNAVRWAEKTLKA